MHDPFAAASDPPGQSPDSVSELEGVDRLADELSARVAAAIPSYRGLTVTVAAAGGDLTLTAIGPVATGAPQTSLGFSVRQRGGGPARFVLYARTPGALLDLYADLVYLGREPHSLAHPRAPTDVRLDDDLPGPELVPGLTGLEDLSTLNRAEGVLIEGGVAPDDVAAQLRLRAAAAGLEPRVYARRLLDR